ncbi:MAG TPA: heavy metal sensor histidine kinase [Bryobacteraceae bacterium]|nr:heavy metal sensor histidine kinase [Bryobacteraceae bacterium]
MTWKRNLRPLLRELRKRLIAMRALRTRLMVAYALFFAVFLIGLAEVFRARLVSTLDAQVHETLDKEWFGVKGYLRIEPGPEGSPVAGKNSANWYYDADDPDETATVLDIKKIFLITDKDGNVIADGSTGDQQVSPTYEDIGIDRPQVIQGRVTEAVRAMQTQTPGTPGRAFWDVRRNSEGARFLIRAGVVFDEGHLVPGRHFPYYMAIGIPLSDNEKILSQFTWVFVAVIPAALILGSFLGWVMAGRALTPVRDIARAAQRISGSNLSLRIPTRETGDELDYLILTFNRMIERLESSFQQMKQFSADVSHELRTPITAIRGQLEVALFTAQTTEQYREAMFNALQDIDRLSQIVRALLLLSQAESGQLVLQKSRLNLAGVALDLVDQFQIPAEAAGVRLTADLPPECFLEGDRVQLERMITNLLSNAIKFTPEGGHVRLLLRATAENVEIVVEDTGRGIATEHLPHIFDRFYRVPGSGSAPGADQGLGLGLSFVAWIVKAHDGSIEVDSEPGKGTRFIIRLPAAGAASDTMELAGQPVGLS